MMGRRKQTTGPPCVAPSKKEPTQMKAALHAILTLLVAIIDVAHSADDWTQRFPNPHPAARVAHAMAYIGQNQVLVLGGDVAIGYDYSTWLYDLSAHTWTQQSSSPNPSARSFHKMAYIGGDQVLLYGGMMMPGNQDLMWLYDLSAGTWTQQSPSPNPSTRSYHAMAYIGGDKVLLHAGFPGPDDETWVYDRSEDVWTQRFPLSRPSARRGHAMAYIGEDRALLFGGHDASGYDDETWVYDLSAGTWTQQFPTDTPSARWGHAMAYIGGDQVMLFGGWDGDVDNETWVYDLSAEDWSLDTNTTQPSARHMHTLSETSLDGSSCPILFGGWSGSKNAETWTFGGGDYLFPFEAMVLGMELINANTARILWSAVAGATHYDLYRSTTAFFGTSDPPWQTVAAPTTQLDVSDGIGDEDANYYFLGKARSVTQTSPRSNTVGEFDFDVSPP